MPDGISGADIFFWFAAGAVVVLAITWLAVLLYAWRMIREVRSIAAFLRIQTRLLADDLEEIRSEARLKDRSWLRLYRLFVGLFRKRKGR